MSDTSSVSQTTLQALGLTNETPSAQPKKELGQAEFFDLMVAQLKFQDPLKPLANTEFVAQMAQFSNVNSLDAIQTSLGELVGAYQSNQALQASTLVGRDVLVSGNVALLPEEGAMAGAVELPAGASDVRVSVFDAAGQRVAELDLGAQAAGRVRFSWDGSGGDGERLAPGPYTIAADGQVGGNVEGLETLTQTRVDSVSLRQSPPGATLNLAGLGPVDMSAVKELL